MEIRVQNSPSTTVGDIRALIHTAWPGVALASSGILMYALDPTTDSYRRLFAAMGLAEAGLLSSQPGTGPRVVFSRAGGVKPPANLPKGKTSAGGSASATRGGSIFVARSELTPLGGDFGRPVEVKHTPIQRLSRAEQHRLEVSWSLDVWRIVT